ncbi:unnamed protein product, partial [Rotaria magnacalcarata]
LLLLLNTGGAGGGGGGGGNPTKPLEGDWFDIISIWIEQKKENNEDLNTNKNYLF